MRASQDTETLLARTARQLLLLHVFLIASLGPIYAKEQLWPSIYPTEIVVAATTVLALGALSRFRWDSLSRTIFLFVLFGVAWVTLGGLGDTAGAGAKAFSFFAYATMYFTIRATTQTDDDRWKFLRALQLAALVGCAIGFLNIATGTYLFTDTEFEITTTGSTRWLGGANALYGAFVVSIGAVEALLTRRLDLSGRVFMAAGAIEVVLAQHRSAFVAVAVALLGAMFVLAGSTNALQRMLKLLAGAVVLATIAIVFVGDSFLDDTWNRLTQVTNLDDPNISWRLLAWFEVLNGIGDQPLGHGFASWDFVFNTADPLTGSHNSFLDLAYRIGIPGLALFLAIPYVFVRSVRERVRAGKLDRLVLAVSACTCLISYLVFASFNVVFETPYLSIFFWVFLAIGAGALADRDREESSLDREQPSVTS